MCSKLSNLLRLLISIFNLILIFLINNSTVVTHDKTSFQGVFPGDTFRKGECDWEAMFWVGRWTAGTQIALTNLGGIPNARNIQIPWTRLARTMDLANGTFQRSTPWHVWTKRGYVINLRSSGGCTWQDWQVQWAKAFTQNGLIANSEVGRLWEVVTS